MNDGLNDGSMDAMDYEPIAVDTARDKYVSELHASITDGLKRIEALRTDPEIDLALSNQLNQLVMDQKKQYESVVGKQFQEVHEEHSAMAPAPPVSANLWHQASVKTICWQLTQAERNLDKAEEIGQSRKVDEYQAKIAVLAQDLMGYGVAWDKKYAIPGENKPWFQKNQGNPKQT